MSEKTIREIMTTRWGELKTERSSWIDHWKELQEYILPRRGRFLGDDRNDGKKKHTRILDNTGTLAARTLASGLMAGLTSPARPWFRLSPPDPDMAEYKPVKEWLFAVESLLLEIFARSNTYNALHTIYRENGTFGTSPMGVLQIYDDVVRCFPFTIGSYCLDIDDKLRPDTLYREVPMTTKMIVQRFGLENVSRTIKTQWDRGSYLDEFKVIHAIEPNLTEFDVKGYGFIKDMPFRSIYWEEAGGDDNEAHDQYLEIKGFHEKPFMAPRWDVLGTDAYGSGPGMDALGDIKQLQVQQRWKGEGISKQVNPAMVAPESLRGKHKTTLPGGVTYFNQGEEAQFKPAYQVNFQMQHLLQDMQETRERISRAFYEDLFLMLTQSTRRQITAREVEERHEEKLLMLGPVLERLEDELLDPLVDRTFAIAERTGLLPAPPPELEEVDLRVEYISILAQAQKAVALNALERTVAFVGGLAQMSPDALDNINVDETISEYGEAAGVAPATLRSPEERDQVRAHRAEQQKQLQQQEQMSAMADAAGKLANVETDKRNLASDAINVARGQPPVDVGGAV